MKWIQPGSGAGGGGGRWCFEKVLSHMAMVQVASDAAKAERDLLSNAKMQNGKSKMPLALLICYPMVSSDAESESHKIVDALLLSTTAFHPLGLVGRDEMAVPKLFWTEMSQIVDIMSESLPADAGIFVTFVRTS
jgi:hypothetical protein